MYSTMSLIATEMAEYGLYGKLRAKDVDKILSHAFPDQQQLVTQNTSPSQILISKEDFMANGSLSADLIQCFGLLRYLNRYLIERIQNAKVRLYYSFCIHHKMI